MAELTEYQKDILIRTALSEAGGEGEEGMADVLHVILNRASSRKFPSDPAKVALQNKQFSSWNKGAGGNNPSKWSAGSAAYQTAARVLEQVATGAKPDQTGGALYFHTPGVNPSWSSGVNTNGKIERNGHVFYPTREAGAVGTQLDVSRPAPTPAKASPAIVASRNRQNMTPAADVKLTAQTGITPALKKDGRGVTDVGDIVFGKEMTTRLPQKPGQTQIERNPQKPGQSVIERNQPRPVKPVSAAPAITPDSKKTAADMQMMRAANQSAPAAKPGQSQIERNPAPPPKPGQSIIERTTTPTKPTSVAGFSGGSRAPYLGSPIPSANGSILNDKDQAQLPALGAPPVDGLTASRPAIQSAAMIAARVPKKPAPVPAVRAAALPRRVIPVSAGVRAVAPVIPRSISDIVAAGNAAVARSGDTSTGNQAEAAAVRASAAAWRASRG